MKQRLLGQEAYTNFYPRKRKPQTRRPGSTIRCLECEAKQAKIDRLMFEFCPLEMTEEQKKEWAKHQRDDRDLV